MKLTTLLVNGTRRAAALTDQGLALLPTTPGTDIGDLLRAGTSLVDFQRLALEATQFVAPPKVPLLPLRLPNLLKLSVSD